MGVEGTEKGGDPWRCMASDMGWRYGGSMHGYRSFGAARGYMPGLTNGKPTKGADSGRVLFKRSILGARTEGRG